MGCCASDSLKASQPSSTKAPYKQSGMNDDNNLHDKNDQNKKPKGSKKQNKNVRQANLNTPIAKFLASVGDINPTKMPEKYIKRMALMKSIIKEIDVNQEVPIEVKKVGLEKKKSLNMSANFMKKLTRLGSVLQDKYARMKFEDSNYLTAVPKI